MNLQWNDRRTRQFITNVGLITSDGLYGPDVMAAEWTDHKSRFAKRFNDYLGICDLCASQ